MILPKLVILDRDGCINVSSSDESSPLYYILAPHHLIVKPNIKEALQIIKSLNVMTVLATKQNCISQGLVGASIVDVINARIQRLTDFNFDDIYIETDAPNKLKLYNAILAKHRSFNPQDIWLFDDSEDERIIAGRLGISTIDGTNLYEAVCKAFKLK